jgi:hypothetical protein
MPNVKDADRLSFNDEQNAVRSVLPAEKQLTKFDAQLLRLVGDAATSRMPFQRVDAGYQPPQAAPARGRRVLLMEPPQHAGDIPFRFGRHFDAVLHINRPSG